MTPPLSQPCPSVPNSINGTLGQPLEKRDTAGTVAGTGDLKALAEKVLSRAVTRDSAGTTTGTVLSQRVGEDGASLGQPGAVALPDGIPVEWREGLVTLRTMAAPAAFPAAEWSAIVETADQLLREWGTKLAALGWTTRDLFGCHPERPRDRFDTMGAVPLLVGREVVLVDDRTMLLKTLLEPGARQTLQRKRGRAAREPAVMLWELRELVGR